MKLFSYFVYRTYVLEDGRLIEDGVRFACWFRLGSWGPGLHIKNRNAVQYFSERNGHRKFYYIGNYKIGYIKGDWDVCKTLKSFFSRWRMNPKNRKNL